LFLAAYQTVKDSLLVADGGGNLLPVSSGRTAYTTYDGAGRLRDSHLVGFHQTNANLIASVGASTKHPNHIFSGLTYADAMGSPVTPRIMLPNYEGPTLSAADPRDWGTVVRDEDGTTSTNATFTGNRSIIANHLMLRTTNVDSRFTNGTNAWVSPHRFGLVTLRYPGLNTVQVLPNVTVTRSRTGEPDVIFTNNFKIDNKHQTPTIVQAYLYTFDYGNALPTNRRITITTDDLRTNERTRLRFKGFGSVTNITASGVGFGASNNSWPNLNASATGGYWKDSLGDLWVDIVNTGKLNTVNVAW
jgi:hypothetical protein